jgi:hypothetical protein
VGRLTGRIGRISRSRSFRYQHVLAKMRRLWSGTISVGSQQEHVADEIDPNLASPGYSAARPQLVVHRNGQRNLFWCNAGQQYMYSMFHRPFTQSARKWPPSRGSASLMLPVPPTFGMKPGGSQVTDWGLGGRSGVQPFCFAT